MGTGTTRDIKSWIEERRVELGLTIDELAERSGVARGTIYNLYNGRNPWNSKKQALEDALGWTRGSIDTVRAGGSPTLVVTAESISPVVDEEPPPVNAEMLESLRFIRRNLATDVPAEEIDKFLYSQFRLWGNRLQNDDQLWRTWHLFLAEERQRNDGDDGTWPLENVT